MVSRTAPFSQLIAGFKSRPHISPWLRPWGLYPQWGSYPCRSTCCPSDPSYLLPRLSSSSPNLLSPTRSTVVLLATWAYRRLACSCWTLLSIAAVIRSTDRSQGWSLNRCLGNSNDRFEDDSDDRFDDSAEDSDDRFDDYAEDSDESFHVVANYSSLGCRISIWLGKITCCGELSHTTT